MDEMAGGPIIDFSSFIQTSSEKLCPVHRVFCDERAGALRFGVFRSSTIKPWMNGAQLFIVISSR
ncbi:MAG: hypothetical protein WCF54_02925 [Terracidiphilus sp.]